MGIQKKFWIEQFSIFRTCVMAQPHLPWLMNKRFYRNINPIVARWMQESMSWQDWWNLKVCCNKRLRNTS